MEDPIKHIKWGSETKEELPEKKRMLWKPTQERCSKMRGG